MKTPVIAVIEYNYEQGGEILIPAGTKATGQLAQVSEWSWPPFYGSGNA